MKRVFSIIMVVTLLMATLAVVSFAGNTSGSLSDVVDQSKAEASEQVEQSAGSGNPGVTVDTPVETAVPNTSDAQSVTTNQGSNTGEVVEGNNIMPNPAESENYSKYRDGLMKATGDITADVEGAQNVTKAATKVAAFIVQVLSYVIVAFLAVRVLIDLLYIAIPMTRTFLANGYGGNPQMGGNMQNAMGMGGMNGMGMNGGIGMGGGMYGRGGYGRGGYGMGGMNGMGMNGMGAMGANNGMAMGNQRNSMFGQVQWVSNAALNAVASESAVGPDGKAPSAFKIYAKDMIVVLIITPVLIVLAATGVLTQLGLIIGEALVKAISKFGAMI